jgi:hypothetical protein
MFFYLDESGFGPDEDGSDLESEEEASDFGEADESVFAGGEDFVSGLAALVLEVDEVVFDEFDFL